MQAMSASARMKRTRVMSKGKENKKNAENLKFALRKAAYQLLLVDSEKGR
jgi:hypothetical protein